MVRVQREAEIAIVDAGPAGAFTALNLAKLGLAQKVAVFDGHNVVGRAMLAAELSDLSY